MIEFVKFLWMRYAQRCRNVGYGRCRWGGAFCRDHRRRYVCHWFGLSGVRLLIDEGMCHSCYLDDYVINYK